MLRLLVIIAVLIMWGTPLSYSGDELKLVLIGVVVDEARQPIQNATVTLLDKDAKKSHEFLTEANGNFYFQLQPENEYTIRLLNQKGSPIATKKISTFDKTEAEVLHAILEGELQQLKGK